MKYEKTIRVSEFRRETFRGVDLFDLREVDTPKSIEEIEPDCEEQGAGGLRFFKLFDNDNYCFEKIVVEDSEFRKIDFKSFGSNFEAFLLEYDFFKKDFVVTASLNFVKSDFNSLLKDEAIESVTEKIIEEWGLLDFDRDFIKTFFDDFPESEE